MKKHIIIALALVAFIACAKKESRKNDPMSPVDVAHDSAEVQATKEAAQKKHREALAQQAAAEAAKGRKPVPSVGKETNQHPPLPNDAGGTTQTTRSEDQRDDEGSGSSNGTGAETDVTEVSKTETTRAEPPANTPPVLTAEDLETTPKTEIPALTNIGGAPSTDAAPAPQGDANAQATQATQGAQGNQTGTENANPSAAPSETTKQVQAITKKVEALQASETYVGSMLTLSYNNKANVGRIRLEGPDAVKLYQTLRVQETIVKGNTDWEDAKVKTGAYVQCFRQAPKTAPRNFVFSCIFFLNYKTGDSLVMSHTPMPNLKVAELTRDYEGTNLFIKAYSTAKAATLRLREADAKALYDVMTVPAQTTTAPQTKAQFQMKKGTNLSCYESEKGADGKAAHVCSVFFNPATGNAFKAQ